MHLFKLKIISTHDNLTKPERASPKIQKKYLVFKKQQQQQQQQQQQNRINHVEWS